MRFIKAIAVAPFTIFVVGAAFAAPSSVPSPEAGVDRVRDSDPCRGDAFEYNNLPRACTTSVQQPAPAGITATLTLDQETVRAGATVGLTLDYINTTNRDVELYMFTRCNEFQSRAYQNGKRADHIDTNCPVPAELCEMVGYRIVLLPGGKLTKRLKFTANVSRMASDCMLERVVRPLAPGSYDIKVDSAKLFTLHDATQDATAHLTVSKLK